MLKKLPSQPQLEMFKTVLASFINPQHELCLLAKEIDWDYLEKEFAPLYGEVGRPSIPIRTIVGLLLLKQIYNLGDETVMERYIDSPYSQHFCGEIYFQYEYSFEPGDGSSVWGEMYPCINVLTDVIAKTKDDPTRSNMYNMARIWKAYCAQVLVDTYGYVPYSEAGKAFLN